MAIPSQAIFADAFLVLVTADAIEAGDRLRIRVVDSDRFSADDTIGIVEMDLADLVEESMSISSPRRRQDHLYAEKRGMKASGELDWSVRFCRLWQMPEDQKKRRVEAAREKRIGEPEITEAPWWLKLIQGVSAETPEWEKERSKRRKETLAWFTGETEREEIEAASRPSDELRSGILQFHIHQCHGKLPQR